MDKNRLEDLRDQALLQGIPVFTHFLDMVELKAVRSIEKKDKEISYREFCAFQSDERRMVGLFPKDLINVLDHQQINEMFPLCVFQVQSSQKSFEFNHRDVLGSLLSMGIDRKVVGDIIVIEDKAYFVIESIFETMMLQESLQIKHQLFSITKLTDFTLTRDLGPRFEELKGSISSIRLDSIVKLCINESRTKAQQLIEKGLVLLNQEESMKVTRTVDEYDIISIRGHGKFKLIQIGSANKKGKIAVVIHRYC